MKKVPIVLLFMLFSQSVFASSVFWKIKPAGVGVNADGSTYIGSSNVVGTNPDVQGSIWTPCKWNVIWIHKRVDGSLISDTVVNRMLAVATSADKSGSSLSIRLQRDAEDFCYTDIVRDLGDQ